MSILTKEDRKDLVYASRKALLEQVRTKGVLTESKKASAENFILNEATYEQLLNLVYNPDRETNYMKTEALEAIAMKEYEEYLTEDVVEESVFGQVEEGAKDMIARKAAGFGKALAGSGVKAAKVAKKSAKGNLGSAAKVAKKSIASKAGKAKAGKILSNKAKDVKVASKNLGKERWKTHGARAAVGSGVAAVGATGYLAGRRKNK